jgi:hypothetical protein
MKNTPATLKPWPLFNRASFCLSAFGVFFLFTRNHQIGQPVLLEFFTSSRVEG